MAGGVKELAAAAFSSSDSTGDVGTQSSSSCFLFGDGADFAAVGRRDCGSGSGTGTGTGAEPQSGINCLMTFNASGFIGPFINSAAHALQKEIRALSA